MNPEIEWWTLREAAARWVTAQPANLRQRIAAGSLRAEKRGRDWFVSTAEMERVFGAPPENTG